MKLGVLDSRVEGFILTPGMQFRLPQFSSVYSAANEYQHCWEGTCDGLASCPGGLVHLHSKLLANLSIVHLNLYAT